MNYGQVMAAFQRLCNKLGENTDTVFMRLIDSEPYMDEVVEKMIRSGYQPNRNHIKAKLIMGDNMFGIDDAIKCFSVYPLQTQLHKLSEIRTSKGRLIEEKELRKYKSTHILVAMFPVWPLKGLNQHDQSFFTTPESVKLFHHTNFPIQENDVGWYLIRKSPPEELFNKEWMYQVQRLPQGETVPKQHVVGYTIAGHFKTTGEALFQNKRVRCATDPLQSQGTRIVIGFDRGHGIFLTEIPDSTEACNLSVATMISQE